MKRSPLPKRTKPLARSTKPIASRCVCDHSKACHGPKYDGVPSTACRYGTDRGDCRCKKYRPKPLPKATKPIKSRKADPKKRRFAARKNLKLRAWIRNQPCYLTGRDWWEGGAKIDASHVKSWGSGGGDWENLLPLEHDLHLLQHRMGIVSWAALYGKTVDDLKAAAKAYTARYDAEHPVSPQGENR